MSKQFDPYHTWLGISPKNQPPTHYRLLGVDLFEANADVIANAADKQMTHIKSFQAGQHSDLSQKILNEISAARVCLLNVAKKLAYDERLRKKMTVPLPVARSPEVKPVQRVIHNDFDFLDPAPTVHERIVKKSRKPFPLALAAVVGGGLLLIGVVAVSMNRSNGTAESKEELALKLMTAPKPLHTPKPDPKVEPKPEPKVEPKPEPKVEPKIEPKLGPGPTLTTMLNEFSRWKTNRGQWRAEEGKIIGVGDSSLRFNVSARDKHY